MREIPRLVIAGVSSGVGKTSLVLALTAALRKRGLRVQSFKCGPDYLDPTYHRLASGRPCHNLDSWMMGSQNVAASFERITRDADIALIEGVMGLFDGASPRSDEGSTAHIAKIVQAPVAVVIDASGMARTIAAIAHGLQNFDPDLAVKGFVANRVGSRGHIDILRQAMEMPLFGGFPKRPDLSWPERHLGLVTADSQLLTAARLDEWAQLCEEYFDVEQLLSLARSAPPLATESRGTDRRTEPYACRIGIAMDEAFHFYYEANLRMLEAEGAELVYFSPLADAALPPDLDALYFGGGYPELFASDLTGGLAMREQIREFARRGRPIYGECGGLMYLSRSIKTRDGQVYPMLDLLPFEVTMHERLQALGYAEVEMQEDSFLGAAGMRFRGHQFRYSSVNETSGVSCLYRVRKRRGGAIEAEGYARDNVLASYVHAHWASNPEIPRAFVRRAGAERRPAISSGGPDVSISPS